jgi:hypothetical protein
MLNGHFIDTVRPLFEKRTSLDVLNRMQVTFGKDVSKVQGQSAIDTLAALDHVSIAFQSEWPLEIILDEDAILQRYNPILRFLMKLKRVNYLLSLRDYWRTSELEALNPGKGNLNLK